jgi:chromosome segregation ATPase
MTTPDPRRKPSGHSTGDPRLNTIVCPDAMPPSPASEGEDIPKQPGHEESSAKRKRQDGHSQNPNRTHGEPSKKLRSEDNGESMVEAFQNFQNFQKAIMGGTKAAMNEDFAQKLSDETYELKKYIKKREFNLVDKMGSKLAPIVTDVASMKTTAATQEEHVSALLGDFTELKTDVTKLEEDVTDLKGDHSLLTQAITDNTKSLATHEDRLNSLSNHEDRLNILSNTTSTMKLDLKINQKAYTTIGFKLDTEVKDLKSCIEVSKETVKDLEKELDIVKADVAQLETDERQRLDKLKTALDNNLAQAQKTHKSAFAQMEEKYKGAMDNLRSELRAQLVETASLKTTLAEAKDKHNEDLASLRSDMAELIEDAKRDIRSEQSIEQAKLEQT